MKFREDKKSAYIDGYTNISKIDKGILAGEDRVWDKTTADWEETGKKPLHDYSLDRITQGKMYRNEDHLFRYSLDNIHTTFEDPTYLGFSVKFDSDNSPLFNYGDYPPVAMEQPTPAPKKPSKSVQEKLDEIAEAQGKTPEPFVEETEEEKKAREENNQRIIEENAALEASPITFIRKYGEIIPEIKKREALYFSFISNLDEIFGRTLRRNKWKKSYYIESIVGLDKLNAKMVNYGQDKITIQLSEDISLRASYLAELYNNLTYSYKNQRYLITENCMRFDMMIEITDMRIFRLLGTDDEGNLSSSINGDPPRIIYTLHDCSFDFSNSLPFQAGITVGGWNANAPANLSILSFDIKYKSISKNFRSSLIYGSLEIHNKLDVLFNSDRLNKTELFLYDIHDQTKILEQEEQSKFSYSESQTAQSPTDGVDTEQPQQEEVIFEDLRDEDFKERRLKMLDIGAGLPNVDFGITKNLSVGKEGDSWYHQEDLIKHVRNGDFTNDDDLLMHNHETSNTNTQTQDVEDGLINDGRSANNIMKKPDISFKDKVKEGLSDFAKGVGNSLKETALENLNDYKDKLIGKYDEIRGTLIKEMLRQVREPFNMPKIYPDNVYSTDFRSLSLESFARGLGSDLLNDVLGGAGDALFGATGLPF